MTIGSIGSGTSAYGANACCGPRMRPPGGNPEEHLNAMTGAFIEKLDQDGNGTLSASEIESLSSDAFESLDTDGDGELNQDEIKAAAQKQMEAMHAAFESNIPQNVQNLLSSQGDTPESQLMEIIHETLPPPPNPYGAFGSQSGNAPFGNAPFLNATA